MRALIRKAFPYGGTELLPGAIVELPADVFAECKRERFVTEAPIEVPEPAVVELDRLRSDIERTHTGGGNAGRVSPSLTSSDDPERRAQPRAEPAPPIARPSPPSPAESGPTNPGSTRTSRT